MVTKSNAAVTPVNVLSQLAQIDIYKDSYRLPSGYTRLTDSEIVGKGLLLSDIHMVWDKNWIDTCRWKVGFCLDNEIAVDHYPVHVESICVCLFWADKTMEYKSINKLSVLLVMSVWVRWLLV